MLLFFYFDTDCGLVIYWKINFLWATIRYPIDSIFLQAYIGRSSHLFDWALVKVPKNGKGDDDIMRTCLQPWYRHFVLWRVYKFLRERYSNMWCYSLLPKESILEFP